MSKNTFRFRITFIWGTEADLWVEIPMELYQHEYINGDAEIVKSVIRDIVEVILKK